MFGQERKNPFEDPLSYYSWAPWVSRAAVRGPEVFNSEFKKDPEYKHSDSSSSDPDKRLTVDLVVELICESSVSIMGIVQYDMCMNMICVEQPCNCVYCWVRHAEDNCYVPVELHSGFNTLAKWYGIVMCIDKTRMSPQYTS